MMLNKTKMHNHFSFKNQSQLSGFTLIELMVATTLFTVVMLMGIGALVTSSNAAKSAQKLRIAVDNVNFAMESMTREIRMGTHYYSNGSDYIIANDNLVGDYTNGTYVAFNPQQTSGSPQRVAYFRKPRGDGTYVLNRCELPGSCSPIVSNEIDVQLLKFTVLGSSLPSDTSDKIQPSVRILMKGVVSVNGVDTPFALQSFASQRSGEE